MNIFTSKTGQSVCRLLEDKGELCVGEVSDLMRTSHQNASHYLVKLHNDGYVELRPEGNRRYYRLTEKGVQVVKLIDTISIAYN